jgi:hypothetical protein
MEFEMLAPKKRPSTATSPDDRTPTSLVPVAVVGAVAFLAIAVLMFNILSPANSSETKSAAARITAAAAERDGAIVLPSATGSAAP